MPRTKFSDTDLRFITVDPTEADTEEKNPKAENA